MTGHPEDGVVANNDTSGRTSEVASGLPETAEKRLPEAAQAPEQHHLGKRRENLVLIFITLSQLVQMIPLGVGINRLGCTHMAGSE